MNYFTRSLPDLFDWITAPLKKVIASIRRKLPPLWTKDQVRGVIKNALKFCGIFIEKIIAPSIVVGGITTACHMKGVHEMLFMLSCLIIYWTWLNKLERKQNLHITAKTTFTVPSDMDPEDVADLIRQNCDTLRVTPGKS